MKANRRRHDIESKAAGALIWNQIIEVSGN